MQKFYSRNPTRSLLDSIFIGFTNETISASAATMLAIEAREPKAPALAFLMVARDLVSAL